MGSSILMYMTVKWVSSSWQKPGTYILCVCVFKTVGSSSQNLLLMFCCFQINKFSFCFPVNKQFLFPWWQCQRGVTLVVISDSVIDLLLTWHFALSLWVIPNQFLSCLLGWLPKAEGHTAFAKLRLATFSPTNPHSHREQEKQVYHFKVIGFCGGIHWDISINLLK